MSTSLAAHNGCVGMFLRGRGRADDGSVFDFSCRLRMTPAGQEKRERAKQRRERRVPTQREKPTAGPVMVSSAAARRVLPPLKYDALENFVGTGGIRNVELFGELANDSGMVLASFHVPKPVPGFNKISAAPAVAGEQAVDALRGAFPQVPKAIVASVCSNGGNPRSLGAAQDVLASLTRLSGNLFRSAPPALQDKAEFPALTSSADAEWEVVSLGSSMEVLSLSDGSIDDDWEVLEFEVTPVLEADEVKAMTATAEEAARAEASAGAEDAVLPGKRARSDSSDSYAAALLRAGAPASTATRRKRRPTAPTRAQRRAAKRAVKDKQAEAFEDLMSGDTSWAALDKYTATYGHSLLEGTSLVQTVGPLRRNCDPGAVRMRNRQNAQYLKKVEFRQSQKMAAVMG